MAEQKKIRVIRKRIELFRVIDKIKLWPSRSGKLHGIRSIEINGSSAKVTTHCNREFFAKNSKNKIINNNKTVLSGDDATEAFDYRWWP